MYDTNNRRIINVHILISFNDNRVLTLRLFTIIKLRMWNAIFMIYSKFVISKMLLYLFKKIIKISRNVKINKHTIFNIKKYDMIKYFII